MPVVGPAKINSMFYLKIIRKSYACAWKNNTNLRKIHKLYSTCFLACVFSLDFQQSVCASWGKTYYLFWLVLRDREYTYKNRQWPHRAGQVMKPSGGTYLHKIPVSPVMVLWSMRFSFQAGIILFPVESLGEMGASPYIISLGDSFIV